MIKKLFEAEQELSNLLKNEKWNSVFVDYEKPFVERLWCQWGDYRVNLHKIHPCEDKESFFHPHPWPSAMKIIGGLYRMDVGYGEGLIEPSVISTCWLNAGSYYEMTDMNAWHSVRPIRFPVYSIMLTGKPWEREMPKHDHGKLPPLSPEQEKSVFDMFCLIYKKKNNE